MPFRTGEWKPDFALASIQTRKAQPVKAAPVPRWLPADCLRLWRAKAVAAGRMIVPLRIVEIDRAAGERVGLQRRPGRISHVRAELDNYRHGTGPRDVERKLICAHSEAGIVGPHLRLPDRCWTTAK